MGKECGMLKEEEKFTQGFGGETICLDAKIILKWILKKTDGIVGTGFIWLQTDKSWLF